MTRKPRPLAATLAFVLACTVCGAANAGTGPVAPAAASAEADNDSAGESRRLHEVLEAYFDEYFQLNPLLATSIGDTRYNGRYEVQISPEWRARDESLQARYLERIKGIDHRELSAEIDRWIAEQRRG